MNAAAVNGTWVLLQNCELGLGLMNEMEVRLATVRYNEALFVLQMYCTSIR